MQNQGHCANRRKRICKNAQCFHGIIKTSYFLFVIILFISINDASAQFGEIASLVTGLLGTGGAGLAGTGASLAGAAGSAGSGISGVLSNFAPLYQLAQTALQLTGTGVGIANQASEGAWFPAAVENAARMNRDFQDRLLGKIEPEPSIEGGSEISRGSGVNSLGLLTNLNSNGNQNNGVGKISKEYGTNFESEEDNNVGDRSRNVATIQQPINLFGNNPSLVTLLPGESPIWKNNIDEKIMAHKSVGPVEPQVRSFQSHIQGIEQNGGPKVRIELPQSAFLTSKPIDNKINKSAPINESDSVFIDHDYTEIEEILNKKPDLEFSVDGNNKSNKKTLITNKTNYDISFSNRNDEELLKKYNEPIRISLPLHRPPPRAIALNTFERNLVNNKEMVKARTVQNVPKLTKLIETLRNSNLNRDEFTEIAHQLKQSKDLLQPRENTARLPELTTQQVGEEESKNGGKLFINEKRDQAVIRNLAALNNVLDKRLLPINEDLVVQNIRSSFKRIQQANHTLERQQQLINNNAKLKHQSKVFAANPYTQRIVLGGNIKNATINQVSKANNSVVSKKRLIVSNTGVNVVPLTSSVANINDFIHISRHVSTRQYDLVNMTVKTTSKPLTFNQNSEQILPHAQTEQNQLTQNQEYLRKQQEYDIAYRNYINYYYSQYPRYYGVQNNQPGYNSQQYTSNVYNPLQGYSYGQQGSTNTVRSIPVRTVPYSISTTPPSAFQHPFSQGALLTLMQPQQYQIQTLLWPTLGR